MTEPAFSALLSKLVVPVGCVEGGLTAVYVAVEVGERNNDDEEDEDWLLECLPSETNFRSSMVVPGHTVANACHGVEIEPLLSKPCEHLYASRFRFPASEFTVHALHLVDLVPQAQARKSSKSTS